MPLGTSIHLIELKPGLGAKLVKSAGTFAILLQKDLSSNFARIKMPSNEERLIPLNCKATVGSVSNNFFFLKKLKKSW